MLKNRRFSFLLTIMVLVAMMVSQVSVSAENAASPAGGTVSEDIYMDALGANWNNWSWGSTQDFSSTTQVYEGNTALAHTLTSAWSSLYLRSNVDLDASVYDTLRFYIHGGTTGGQKYTVKVQNASSQPSNGIQVIAEANTWKEVTIKLSDIGAISQIRQIMFQDATAGPQPTVYLDKIQLLSSASIPNASIDPATAVFDQTTGAVSDITVNMMLNSYVFNGIFKGEVALIQGTDYLVSDNVVTISKDYVAKQWDSQIKLRFDFSGGIDPVLEITNIKNEIKKDIYTDSLASFWGNWSWGSSINFSNAAPTANGNASIALTTTAPSGALFLHSDIHYAVSKYDTLSFNIHGGATGGQTFSARVIDAKWASVGTVNVTAQANAWTTVTIPLQKNGSLNEFWNLVIMSSSQAPQATVYIDDIRLTGPVPTVVTQPVEGPALNIDAAAGKHRISPDIYGVNWNTQATVTDIQAPVRRWGGNATTRYNWTNNLYNAANDWFYENLKFTIPDYGSNYTGCAADLFVDQNLINGADTIMTMPLIGWTTKDAVPGTQAHSFSVEKYGPQRATDQYRPDAGNGRRPDNSYITGNDPLDTSYAIDTTFVTNWTNYLVNKYGTAADGGIKYYSMDNEPELWHSSHRDVHPAHMTYEEIMEKTVPAAQSIKSIDPSAKILGPVTDMFVGDNRADKNAHGGLVFGEWYLQQMNNYEQQNGVRLLDYLDMHYYPATPDIAFRPAGDEDWQLTRLRSTRSLWDPTYYDESYRNKPLFMIRNVRNWIDQYYPGTKLAISEYHFGAADHINGAVTQAEVLGIFGREGVDLATIWGQFPENNTISNAFKMYTNYDNNSSKFGDLGVSATSADLDKVSVYSAIRQSDGAMTMMVLNKTFNDQNCALNLSNFATSSMAEVYRYSEANLSGIVREADIAMTQSGTSMVFPKMSVTLIVIPNNATLKVKSFNANQTAQNNTVFPRFEITNHGDTAIDLSEVKAKYYYTVDGEKNQNFFCDWSSVGKANVTGSFVKMTTPMENADYYLEVGFTAGAGMLQPGQSIEVHTRFGKTDWSNYSQTNDYSFKNGINSYTDGFTTPLYLNGTLCFGFEPLVPHIPVIIPEKATLKAEFMNANRTAENNTLFPRFKLTNTGNSVKSLADIKMRYYYTIDGQMDQNFWCDWSTVGSSAVTGTFVQMAEGKDGADSYLEIGFTEAAGSLAPGQSIEVHARVGKADWSSYWQTNDYSFNAFAEDYGLWDMITLYHQGVLYSGIQP